MTDEGYNINLPAVRALVQDINGLTSDTSNVATEVATVVLDVLAFAQIGSQTGAANGQLQQTTTTTLDRLISTLGQFCERLTMAADGYQSADAQIAQGFGGGPTIGDGKPHDPPVSADFSNVVSNVDTTEDGVSSYLGGLVTVGHDANGNLTSLSVGGDAGIGKDEYTVTLDRGADGSITGYHGSSEVRYGTVDTPLVGYSQTVDASHAVDGAVSSYTYSSGGDATVLGHTLQHTDSSAQVNLHQNDSGWVDGYQDNVAAHSSSFGTPAGYGTPVRSGDQDIVAGVQIPTGHSTNSDHLTTPSLSYEHSDGIGNGPWGTYTATSAQVGGSWEHGAGTSGDGARVDGSSTVGAVASASVFAGQYHGPDGTTSGVVANADADLISARSDASYTGPSGVEAHGGVSYGFKGFGLGGYAVDHDGTGAIGAHGDAGPVGLDGGLVVPPQQQPPTEQDYIQNDVDQKGTGWLLDNWPQ